jgi:hypothetical protein
MSNLNHKQRESIRPRSGKYQIRGKENMMTNQIFSALSVGDHFANGEVVATIVHDGTSIAVIEDADKLMYFGRKGVICEITKPVSRIKIKPFPAAVFRKLLKSREDYLGKQVLSQGEPSYERVVDLFPRLHDYTFIGDRDCAEKLLVNPDGHIKAYFQKAVSGYMLPEKKSLLGWGLLGGYLPAVNLRFRNSKRSKEIWEELVFAGMENGHLRVWVRQGKIGRKNRYWYSKSTPVTIQKDGKEFYAALLTLKRNVDNTFTNSLCLSVPEERIGSICKTAIQRMLLTFVGNESRYGVEDYSLPLVDGLPQNIIDTGNVLLEWGIFSTARDLIEKYLARYINDDGSIDCYGATVSEYGQLLNLLARYFQLTGDARWLKNHFLVIQNLVGWITRARDKSGLIRGLSDADYHKKPDHQNEIYYGGNILCWRGLEEMGKAFVDAGGIIGDSRLRDEGGNILKRNKSFGKKIREAVQNSIVWKNSPPFVPPFQGGEKDVFPTMTSSIHASYANYRNYPEMLGGGFLSTETASLIIRYREEKGGELLGMTRFEKRLDDWVLPKYARGLLDLDSRDRFLLHYYSHLAHGLSVGTFMGYEQVELTPAEGQLVRRHIAHYCVSTQSVAPLLTKWMLVCEEWDTEVLWLNKMAPSSWFLSPDGLEVKDAPTRWGKITYTVKPSEDGARISVSLKLSDRPGRQNVKPTVKLRLPLGPNRNIDSVELNGKPWRDFEKTSNTISFPITESITKIEVVVALPKHVTVASGVTDIN